MNATFDPQALWDAAIARRIARGENVRCPICKAGISKPCIGGSHAERIALGKKG